jgi:hypothetical protein
VSRSPNDYSLGQLVLADAEKVLESNEIRLKRERSRLQAVRSRKRFRSSMAELGLSALR